MAGTEVLVSWKGVGSEDLMGISGDGIAAGVNSSFCTCGAFNSGSDVSISSSSIGAGAGLGDSACGIGALAVGSVDCLIGLGDLSLECRLLYGDPDRGLVAIE